MRASFLHLGDVHLGNDQYGRKERAQDFADAFHYALDYAIEHRVDFIIVAGDLFERATLDPMTFDQALTGLNRLAASRIPFFAIAGNHDRARYGQEIGWLESLGRQGFLQYLDAVAGGAVSLAKWSYEEGIGGYLDYKGVRLVGFKYIGAATPRVVEELGRQLAELNSGERPYTVAMIHAGLDGEVPNFRAELTYEQLAPLRGIADYVALGHLHKHYVREDWVYNPGSLETWNASEVQWERGFLHVEVDTSAEPKHRAKLIVPPRRPFLRYRLEVQLCGSPEDLKELVRRNVEEWAKDARETQPVVHLTLAGRLRFDRRDLDLGSLQAELSPLNPLVVQVRDQTDETDFGVDLKDSGTDEDAVDPAKLEMEVFRQILSNDDRFVHKAKAWAILTQRVENDLIAGHTAQEIADLIRREAPPLWVPDVNRQESAND